MEKIQIATTAREEIIDITSSVAQAVATHPEAGAVLLFCQHTTCGLTINESADPDVRVDLARFFNLIAPHRNGWRHSEGNTDAHIRSSLLGASLLVPVERGRLALGTWQAIYLYEGDGPRTRTVLVQYLMSPASA